ncbi:MAG: hypothetical protein WCI73_15870, partial [Phycisphaerae bacterium]
MLDGGGGNFRRQRWHDGGGRMKMRAVKSRRRGMILIAVTWLLIVLAAMTIILTNRMAVEALASANQLSQLQADAAERGAEQFVLEQLVANSADAKAIYSITADQMSARPIGDSYFWILRPNSDDPKQYDFGITDEASKINVNSAGANVLLLLPNLTQDIVDAISAWRSSTGPASQNGAGDSYYMTLPDPYHCKGAPLESVEELLLLRGITSDLLFGQDLNHNGALEDGEQLAAANGSGGAGGGGTSGATGAGGGPGLGLGRMGTGGGRNITLNVNSDGGRGGDHRLPGHSGENSLTRGGQPRLY